MASAARICNEGSPLRHQLTVRLCDEALRRVAELAQAEGRSQSQVVERMILEHLAESEAQRMPEDIISEMAPGQRDEHGREVNKAVRKAPAEFVPHDPQKEFTKPRVLRGEIPKPGWKDS